MLYRTSASTFLAPTLALAALALSACSGHGGSGAAATSPITVDPPTSISFEAPENTAVGDAPTDLAIADFNGDSLADAATANSASNDITVVSNASLPDGSGPAFGGKTTVAVANASASLSAGDFNDDGMPDLAVLGRSSGVIRFLRNDTTIGQASASFSKAGNAMLANSTPWSVVSGDWNGDDREDVAVSADGNILILDNSRIALPATGTSARTARVQPDLTLAAGPAMGPLLAADTDGDGKSELAAASMTGNQLYLFPNNGVSGAAISFASASVFDVGSGPIDIASADLDGDGKPEIVTANQLSQNLTVLVNQGGNTFTSLTLTAANTTPISIAIADVDHDGKPDLLVGDLQSKAVLVARNQSNPGAIVFSTAWTPIALGASPSRLRTVDWNGDGAIDLLTASQDEDSITARTGSP